MQCTLHSPQIIAVRFSSKVNPPASTEIFKKQHKIALFTAAFDIACAWFFSQGLCYQFGCFHFNLNYGAG